MSISGVGFAFQAINVQSKSYTKDELSSENINLDKQNIDKSSNNLIAFEDTKADKLVVVNLSDTNLSKLKSNFDDSNFFQREDGVTRLTDKAESFVSGWYQDIAYNREFLKADTNSDGKLDDKEYGNTKNEFIGTGEFSNITDKTIDLKLSMEKKYVTVNSDSLKSYKQSSSIEEELNNTIKLDKNLNGKMETLEAITSFSENNNLHKAVEDMFKMWESKGYISIRDDYSIKDIVDITFQDSEKINNNIDNSSLVNQILNDIFKNSSEITESGNDNSDKKDNINKNTILKKLIDSGGSKEVLSIEEKATLNKEINSISSNIFSNLIENIKQNGLLDIKV